MEYIAIEELQPNPENPRQITQENLDKLVKSLREFPRMLELRPFVVTDENVVLGGNQRLEACKQLEYEAVPVMRASNLTDKEKERFVIADNVPFGDWDWDVLGSLWNTDELEEWGLEIPELDKAKETVEESEEQHNPLNDRFVVPPFSVLDTRKGYWKERKQMWLDLIGFTGGTREGTLSESELMGSINEGVSILDPVLAELACRWFAPDNAATFDCFAGDSIFGFIATSLQHKFTGIELRQEQVQENEKVLQSANARFVCDDGQNVAQYIEPASQDLLFSCPPYFNLEVYSDHEQDASNQANYQEFLQLLENAFTESINCLKGNRFAVIVVGDLRKNNGAYYRLPDAVKDIFTQNGMQLYNELILVEPLGTLPQRVGNYMANRKVGKCHQNVLVFYKGEVDKIQENFPEIKISEDNIEQ